MLYLAWLPLLGFRGIFSNYFSIDTIFITILLNCLLLLDLILDMTKSRLKVGYIVLFFIFAAFIIVLNKQALAFFNTMVAVYLLRKINIDDFLKYVSLCSVFNLFFILFCFVFSINDNELVVMPKGDAYNLGFNNTNTASSFLMINLMVIVLWLYTKNKITTVFFIPLFYFIYTITLARTSFVAELVFYLAFIFNIIKGDLVFNRFIPIFIYALTFILTYYGRIYSWINELFTTRFYIYDSILSNFGFMNFIYGITIPEGQPMDSSFLALLFDGGVIYVLIFLYLYNNYYKLQLFNGCYLYFPFVLFVLAAGFSENIFSSFNFISIIFFKILYDKTVRIK